MYVQYSSGFLIASLVQAGIIMLSESLGISTLGANLTALQLLTHILAGQFVGYLFLFTIRKLEILQQANIWISGAIAGIIAWIVLLTINSTMGKVNSPWSQGFPTILSSVTAFIVFGLIASYTIKTYSYDKVGE